MWWCRGLLGLALLPGASLGWAQQTLLVRTPANLEPALTLVAADLMKTHPGVAIKLVQTKSARPDLVIEEAGGPRQFAQDRLVIVMRQGDERVTKLAHLGLSMLIAVPSTSDPVGRHVAKTLAVASAWYGKDWKANLQRNLKVRARTPAEAVALVIEKKADAAVVNGSAARSSGLRSVPIPIDIADEIHLRVTILHHRTLASAFLDALYSASNQARLESFGFTSVLRAPAELEIRRPSSLTKLFTAAISSMPQASVVRAGSKASGADLRGLFAKDRGAITFIGADELTLTVPASAIKRRGGVLVRMPDGNYQVLVPGAAPLKWLRRIEVR